MKNIFKSFSLSIILFSCILFSCKSQEAILLEKSITVNGNEYIIQDVLINLQESVEISAIVVRRSNVIDPKPVILQYTIYAEEILDLSLLESVDNGYVGIMAYSRGKRKSSNEIWPYEFEANDLYQVIDWISSQKWCNGKIGMFGGSYNGFTQWAATKRLHPNLKTIVPYVANRPGMGLPMENNIFLNPNYEWAFYVTNSKFLDTLANDRKRTIKMQDQWWKSGVAYEQIDSIDQRPNQYFQKWIDHPSFDAYWQSMAPYKEEFADINIPILTIDGYYNDSQNSSLYYLREHYKYHPEAEHYLVIGPYNHFGTQRGGNSWVNGYKVSQKSLFNINKLTYQWFDYIMNNGEKPEMLKDKINYFVMGTDEWRSAKSIEGMKNDSLILYLTNEKLEDFHTLKKDKPQELDHIEQTIDFADRSTMNNNNYYPDPIELEKLNLKTGLVFISKPLQDSMLINGSFEGEIIASINKKDMDIGVTLFELHPNGKYFHLSYSLFRASYTQDITERNLLKPNTRERIPFSNTHLVSKKLNKGSRLVIVLDVNKESYSQLNYGTGKDVSKETIRDANDPLKVKWYNESYVEIPIYRLVK